MKTDKRSMHKYKRFFAFGCSFTRWYWPSWADIIGKEMPYYENWARGGAGNDFIYNSVIEANQRHKFNEDDLVIIMYTSIHRESKYVDDRWIMHPSVHEKHNKFHFIYSPKGYLIRDLAYMTGIKHILNTTNYRCTMMYPFWSGPNWPNTSFVKASNNIYNGEPWDHNEIEFSDVIELHKDTLSEFYPSIGEVVFNHDWDNGIKKKFKDKHPLPIEHLKFVQKTWPDLIVSDDTIEWVKDETQKVLEMENMPDVTVMMNNNGGYDFPIRL
jgi:hypothetical protein